MKLTTGTRTSLSRKIYETVKRHLSILPNLHQKYISSLHISHIFARPAFYEISDKCNLRCEGCYYFDPATFQGSDASTRQTFDAHWESFLAREQERGVTMLYFLGAEPALEQKRLLTASRYFRRGNLGTNGTVRLDPEIPYRISISAWAADEAEDARLRGGSVLRRSCPGTWCRSAGAGTDP